MAQNAGRYTSEDLHRALFPNGPPKRKTLKQLEEGIRRYMRKRHRRQPPARDDHRSR